jgi:putative CocE/NonD family hydrolase
MPDGARLAARIWLPTDAEANPVPALLEYLPYRRRDGTAARDAVTQPYMARHGYAAVRVDIRGTGDSDGVITDEYDEPEIADGVAVIAWLAAQPWCSGAVGMWGISWGGINALQVAARQPPALRAIMPMGFAHDRYDGDCHFMGGCLLEGNISWGTTFLAGSARPPDPDVVGPGWRAQWLQRLEALTNPIETWLTHQRRDDYWKPGSVCEDYSRIRIPVYAVSGWQDSYARNVFPLIRNLSAPWKALIGPWAHAWPHAARPGPAIGFLQEALRWWDHWLKNIDTGIMAEPAIRLWRSEWSPPAKLLAEAPGEWITATTTHNPLILNLTENGLATHPTNTTLPVSSPQTTGHTAGYQTPYGAGPDLPDDQREDDAASLCFDSKPLKSPIEIAGEIHLDLLVASNAPQALVAARLCEVNPEGASLRVSYGLLNLSHREGPARPHPPQHPDKHPPHALRRRPPLRRRQPHPHRALHNLLAHRLALPHPNHSHPPHQRQHPLPATAHAPSHATRLSSPRRRTANRHHNTPPPPNRPPARPFHHRPRRHPNPHPRPRPRRLARRRHQHSLRRHRPTHLRHSPHRPPLRPPILPPHHHTRPPRLAHAHNRANHPRRYRNRTPPHRPTQRPRRAHPSVHPHLDPQNPSRLYVKQGKRKSSFPAQPLGWRLRKKKQKRLPCRKAPPPFHFLLRASLTPRLARRLARPSFACFLTVTI